MMGMASSSGSGKSGNFSIPSKEAKPPADNVERRANAVGAIKLICESQVFLPHLEAQLAMQDAQVRLNLFASKFTLKFRLIRSSCGFQTVLISKFFDLPRLLYSTVECRNLN